MLYTQYLPPATKLRQGNVLHLSVILFTGGGSSRSLSGESLSRGVFVTETPPCMVMCGRYTSYWNTFLLNQSLPQSQPISNLNDTHLYEVFNGTHLYEVFFIKLLFWTSSDIYHVLQS